MQSAHSDYTQRYKQNHCDNFNTAFVNRRIRKGFRGVNDNCNVRRMFFNINKRLVLNFTENYRGFIFKVKLIFRQKVVGFLKDFIIKVMACDKVQIAAEDINLPLIIVESFKKCIIKIFDVISRNKKSLFVNRDI